MQFLHLFSGWCFRILSKMTEKRLLKLVKSSSWDVQRFKVVSIQKNLLACTHTLQSSHTSSGLRPSSSSKVLWPNGLGLSVLVAKHSSGIIGKERSGKLLDQCLYSVFTTLSGLESVIGSSGLSLINKIKLRCIVLKKNNLLCL